MENLDRPSKTGGVAENRAFECEVAGSARVLMDFVGGGARAGSVHRQGKEGWRVGDGAATGSGAARVGVK